MTTTPIRLTALAVVGLAAVALSGCVIVPAGPVATEQHTVGDDVHALRLETSADVEVRLGDEPGLVLRGAAAVLDRLTVEQVDGVLVLGSDRPGFLAREVRAQLTVPAFDTVEIEGSGDVDADLSQARRVTISIEGSGDVDAVGLDAEEVRVEIAGSGDVELSGRTHTASYRIAGSGDIDAEELEARDARAEIAGSGDIALFASATLDADISGSGEIAVRGGAEVSRRIDGLGDIHER